MLDRAIAKMIPTLHDFPSQRHWSPQSQRYAPGDVLLAYFQNGWTLLDPSAEIERVAHAGPHTANVFLFRLTDGVTVVEMPVVASPRVCKIVEDHEAKLVRS